MNKKLAFFMASIMALSLVPNFNSNQFEVLAASTNKLSNGNITVSEKTLFYEPGVVGDFTPSNTSKVKRFAEGNYLNIKVDEGDTVATGATFALELENAKFAFGTEGDFTSGGNNLFVANAENIIPYSDWKEDGNQYYNTVIQNENRNEVYNRKFKVIYTTDQYDLVVQSDDYATVVMKADVAGENTIKIPMVVRMNENLTSGTAKVRVSGGNSGVSSGTYSLATINKGSTNAYVSDPQTGKNKIVIDELIIKENVAGSMRFGGSEDYENGFYLELPSGYRFQALPNVNEIDFVNLSPERSGENGENDAYKAKFSNENSKRRMEFTFSKSFKPSVTSVGRIVIHDLVIIPTSSSDNFSREDVKISIGSIGSDDMVTSQDFKVGIHADYGVNIDADSEIPTILNGYYDTFTDTNDRTKSAKITVAEETKDSLVKGGDLTFTVSDKAKIRAVKIEDKENISNNLPSVLALENKTVQTDHDLELRENKVTIRGIDAGDEEKAKFSISFYLSVEPGYEGDVTVKVSGDAVRNSSNIEPITIAKTINPINTKVETTYINPGETIELGDIVFTEQLNSKGYSSLEEGQEIKLGFKNNNNYLSVVGTPEIKTENGLTVKDIKTSNRNNSALSFTIDEESDRNKVSKITISGLKIAANSNMPQGTYEIVVGGSAIAGNSTNVIRDGSKGLFTTDGLTVAKLQYGGSVEMKITVGDKTVIVDGKEIEMKLAPFIDAETGTTYMQVSDIVKATGRTCSFFDNRIQKISDMNENLFVTFGNRTFEKDSSIVKINGQVIPETMTNEEGTPVKMIIKDDYACLPLRYFVEKVLGQQINWNGSDSTITIE